MFVLEKFPAEMYDSAGISQLEATALSKFDITADELMGRAAVGALTASQAFYPEAESVAIICGKGNNAGDGLVLAQLYQELEIDVTIFHLCAIDDFNELPRQKLRECEELGLDIEAWRDDIDWDDFDLIVDAMLGTGIQGAAKEPFKSAIDMINEATTPVLSLDVPSGIDVDTGHVVGNAIIADTTITFLGFKQGLFTGAALDYVGVLYLDDLDLPDELFAEVPPESYRLSRADAREGLSARLPSSHKGNFGHVLILGGDYGFPGAVSIAAQGAYRAGAGLVSVITRPEHVSTIVSSRPEVMCLGVEQGDDISDFINRASVIVIGPGLGRSGWSRWLWTTALAANKLMVVDASALDFLANNNERRDNWILTPHPGEAGRLLNCSIDEVQANRFSSVAAIQEKYGGVALLKGAGTLIQSENNIPEICPYGNPGMACGGMGDLLSGVIASLAAQHLEIEQAARVGAIIHSMSADKAVLDGERGLLALDLLPFIRALANPEDVDEDDDEDEDEDVFDEEDSYADLDDDDYDDELDDDLIDESLEEEVED